MLNATSAAPRAVLAQGNQRSNCHPSPAGYAVACDGPAGFVWNRDSALPAIVVQYLFSQLFVWLGIKPHPIAHCRIPVFN
jgi:hypothetical protein